MTKAKMKENFSEINREITKEYHEDDTLNQLQERMAARPDRPLQVRTVRRRINMNPELKKAWDDVLFWAKRLSYNSADNHPHWKDEYKKAKERLNEIKTRLEHNHE